MADNAFDDLPPGLVAAPAAAPAVIAAAPPASTGNAFDDISPNAPPPIIRDGSAGPKLIDGAIAAVKRLPSQVGHAATDAVTAIPLMAMDAGVAARNLIAGRDEKGNYPYTLPSSDVHAAEDQAFGAPQTTGERIGNVLSSALMSGGAAAAENAPNTIRTLAAPTPQSAAQVPSNFLSPADSQAQQLAQALQKYQGAGYVVPPSTTNPTATNKVLETIAGKTNVAGAASASNSDTVTKAVAQDLGLNPDAPLTLGAIQAVKKETGGGWDQMRALGEIPKDNAFASQLQAMRGELTSTGEIGTKDSPLVGEIDALLKSGNKTDPTTLTKLPDSFTGAQAVNKITDLRNSADVAFRAGDGSLGRGYRQLSSALEDQVQRAAETRAAAGDSTFTPNVVQNFKNSRQLYAKASTAENAFDEGTGKISLQKLGQMYANDEPLSGNMQLAGQFANSFRKASQDPTKIGSQVNHLDMYAPMLSIMEGNTLAEKAAGFAVPAARMGTKAYLMSALGQKGAVPSVTDSIANPSAAIQARTAALVQALQASKRNDAPAPQLNLSPAY